MNKKTKWGIIILIGAGIIGGGIYSQLPKTNDELAAADKVKNTQKNGKKILNVNAKVIKPQLLTDEYTTTGVLLPDEEVDLSFETSGRRNARKERSTSCQGKRPAVTGTATKVGITTKISRGPSIPTRCPAQTGRSQ